MSLKEEFKTFVKLHPELIKYVRTDEMTWQKFFEIYSLYGKDNEVWNKYFKKEETVNSNSENEFSINELVKMAKNVDLEALQKNITNINKGLSLIESLISGGASSEVESYTPRPLYRKFED